MKFIENWGFKLNYSLKRLVSNGWSVAKNMLTAIGLLVTLHEAASVFLGYKGLSVFYYNYADYILLLIFAVSVYLSWENLIYKVNVKSSPDVAITLKVCDALDNEGSVIIPTNSTFDTTMEEDFISKDSLQGQYQLKYFENSLLELDKLIDEGLKNKNFVTLHDGRKTKKNRYPIGTVSKVSEGNIKKRAYFLADSDIRPNGVPIDVEASIISEALVGLWDSLTEIRHMETCSIPLIGTGKAGAADVSRNDVVKQIVISFLAATKSHKITENLIICIHPQDYSKIDWIELCEFLKYQCLFANEIEKKDKSVGKAEKTPPDIRLNDIETDGTEIYKNLSNSSFIEKGKLVIELLQGNEMNLNEIAVAIGWSLGKTLQLMNALKKNNLVMCKRTINGKIYYLGE